MDKKILHDKYEIIEQIGKGGFGEVFKVLNKQDNNFYALKIINIEKDKDKDKNLEIIQNEVDILKMFNNEYIVKYYESFIDGNYFCIIMEYFSSDLSKFINKYKKMEKMIDQKQIYSFVIDICLGFIEIHKKGVIHRDLKPNNLFIDDKNNRIKIGDFGISKKLNNSKNYALTQKGTFNYMSPELINGQPYKNKVDIWAFGCIIYELLTLNKCFYCEYIAGLVEKINCGKYENINLNYYIPEWQNLIDLLLKKDYKERPNIEEVYELIKKFNFNEIRMIFLKENDAYKNYNHFIKLNELNDTNVELFINNEKYKYQNHYNFKIGEKYKIRLNIKNTIQSCNEMFYNCYNLKEINLSSFDFKNVNDMSYMFFECYNLEKIYFSSFDTKNVTDMSYMFYNCYNLKEIDLSSFNTKHLNYMNQIFFGCINLEKIDFSSFNSNSVINSSKLFSLCKNLKYIIVKKRNNINSIINSILENNKNENINTQIIYI